MAKTALERKKEQLERDEAKAKQAAHKVDAFFTEPFDEWMGERWYNYVTHDLDLVGLDPHIPFPGEGNIDPFWQEGWNEGPNRGAIGCAERALHALLAASSDLAHLIHEYKLGQFNARIAELEASDLTDPDARKQALADIVRLTKYRDQLSKQVRWTVPQWKVKGE